VHRECRYFSADRHPATRAAGSRQPLLVRDARSVRNARFAMHKRTSARAAGVSPPWFDDGNALRRNAAAKRQSRAQTNVSNSGAASDRVNLPRSGQLAVLLCRCTDVCRRNSDFCDTPTHVSKSGGRPSTVVQSIERCPQLYRGRVRTTRFPRGADAPRSCVGVRTFAGGTATFAVHKRTCTRAAGDSPPWYGHTNAVPRVSQANGGLLFSEERTHDQERRALARRGSNSRLRRHLLLWTDYVSPRTFASHTTAGSRQPLLVRDARSVRNARFAMHKRTCTRAAGVRPPWFGDANAVPRASYIVQQRPNTQSRAARRQPAVVRSYDRCAVRGECCCSARSEHTTRSGAATVHRGCYGNALAGTLPQSRRRLPSVCSRTPVQSR
jgi:hypothetical protein